MDEKNANYIHANRYPVVAVKTLRAACSRIIQLTAKKNTPNQRGKETGVVRTGQTGVGQETDILVPNGGTPCRGTLAVLASLGLASTLKSA